MAYPMNKDINLFDFDYAAAAPPTKSNHQLRVLHTSDWHIGKRFNDIQRYDEFEEFLDWLIIALNHHAIDVLIVAGDIFDTTTPSNKSQALYYQFLGKVIQTKCRHVVIVAGNHDSPTFLQAPKSLLQHLNIHIVGLPTESMEDELIVLTHKGVPEAIVCAVPYLRDKDIRDKYTSTEFGDSQATIESSTVIAIQSYYQDIQALARQKQQDVLMAHGIHIPIIATGHFFAVGARPSSEDDGMRDIATTAYVGTLGAVDITALDFDYVALGHIHKAQMIGKQSHIRYSGSPLVMGFGECQMQKYVLLVDFDNANKQPSHPSVHALAVPTFRHIVQIKGDLNDIKQQIKHLYSLPENTHPLMSIEPKPIFIDIHYTGKVIANLVEKINECIDESMIIISIKDYSIKNDYVLTHFIRDISQIKQEDVFDLVLNTHDYDENDKSALKKLYQSVVQTIQETDVNAV